MCTYKVCVCADIQMGHDETAIAMTLTSDYCVIHHNVKEQSTQLSRQVGRSINGAFSRVYRGFKVILMAL